MQVFVIKYLRMCGVKHKVRLQISLHSILCMLIGRMEMGTSRVSGDSDQSELIGQWLHHTI